MKAIVCHAPEDLRLDNFETDSLGTLQLQVDVAYGGGVRKHLCFETLRARPQQHHAGSAISAASRSPTGRAQCG